MELYGVLYNLNWGSALTNPTPLPPKISTPYNTTKIALNYINKGLFCSPGIELLNRPLFIKYKAISSGAIRGVLFDVGGSYPEASCSR